MCVTVCCAAQAIVSFIIGYFFQVVFALSSPSSSLLCSSSWSSSSYSSSSTTSSTSPAPLPPYPMVSLYPVGHFIAQYPV
jgi:hypothetical protein